MHKHFSVLTCQQARSCRGREIRYSAESSGSHAYTCTQSLSRKSLQN